MTNDLALVFARLKAILAKHASVVHDSADLFYLNESACRKRGRLSRATRSVDVDDRRARSSFQSSTTTYRDSLRLSSRRLRLLRNRPQMPKLFRNGFEKR
jgi:hypothetical protein